MSCKITNRIQFQKTKVLGVSGFMLRCILSHGYGALATNSSKPRGHSGKEEQCFELATTAVVVGLLAEYWFPAKHLFRHWFTERKLPLRESMEIVGGILVVVGVAGELFLQNRASITSSKIRDVGSQIETAATIALEEEKKKRVDLAASLLPRILIDQNGASKKLALLPKMTVVLEFSNESEPRAMAEQLNFVFESVGWKTLRRKRDESVIREGITISEGAMPSPSYELFDEQRKIAGEAATALVQLLGESQIDASNSPTAEAFDLPPTNLLVRVGIKPNHELEKTLGALGPSRNRLRSTISGNRASVSEENPTSQVRSGTGK